MIRIYSVYLLFMFCPLDSLEHEFKEVQEITKRRKFELSKFKGLNLYLNLIIILYYV